MTPRMVAALEAAERAGEDGLEWCRAGWRDPAALLEYHNPVIVSRLLYDRGFLTASGPTIGPRQRRHINDAGRAWLAAHRKGKTAHA